MKIVFHDTVANGRQNSIWEADYASIFNGDSNFIDRSDFSTIVNGVCNTITNNTRASFIAGGTNNNVFASCTAILGGANNSDGGFPFSAVFGNGLTSVAADTFHVSCLNAVNTPLFGGAYPSGTIQRYALPTPALGLPAGTTILIIQ